MTKTIFVMITFGLVMMGCEPATKDGLETSDVTAIEQNVITTNADIAFAVYSDSLLTAKNLQQALLVLVNTPSEDNLLAARQAWLLAREPYGQSEIFRFRGGPIDALKSDGTMGKDGDGPEGRINAWPLGEALIDYVAEKVDGNAGPESPANIISGNIIGNIEKFPVINEQVLEEYFEYGEDERNVTIGYHGIEFLLWGQDLNLQLGDLGLRDASAGQRPVSDYYTQTMNGQSRCTSGNKSVPAEICKRRGEYLLAASNLLIKDLAAIVKVWDPVDGAYYQYFVSQQATSVAKILESMGRLSYGELAGERINIALTTDSQEDEHSCFSDNTHRDILLNAKGIQNNYLGRYQRVDGQVIQGQNIAELLIAKGYQSLANQLTQSLEATMQAAQIIDTKAKSGMPFDMLIQQGVNQPEVSELIKRLVKQTDLIEQVIVALELSANALRQDTEQDIGA
jgi:putative iron-regulated protein